MAISNLQIANNFIKEVKKIGCGFSLDDFGSGLSSLSYLKNLDVDRLKVDGVFIRDIIKDPIDEEMVSSINNIGHVMGMKTVAEYVENDAIAEKLIKMGFDYLQGNAIGKPKPLSEILG
jgi:EAL domain-containing protein (putative c-di-GMP-specific phosphodiesterase class I)